MTVLGAAAWPELEGGAPRILAVPLGATEQHGPHLPLGTDTLVAEALASGLAAARADVVVAPALPYGSSGEHGAFPGTLSIGQEVTELVVVELVRSADAFAGVVLVSAHGGNAAPLRRAASRLSSEGRRVLAWEPPARTVAGAVGNGGPPAGDAHAGRVETSVTLALRPDLVNREAAERPRPRPVPLPDLLETLRSVGVRPVAPDGVLGNPRGASAEEGRAILDALVADLVDAVGAWAADRPAPRSVESGAPA